MLKSIHIQNYALIEHLKLDFQSGLNVITGETGAGKSIIIGALGLVLGNRVESNAFNTNARKCVIEAAFDLQSDRLRNLMLELDLDLDDFLHIRREISPNGKSRSFVNDTPVGVNELKRLATFIIDINNQNQTYLFRDREMQLAMLDDLVENSALLAAYQSDYYLYKQVQKQLQLLVENEKKAREQQDFIQFQFDELYASQLQSGEEQSLRSELQWMNHAELIKQALFFATQNLTQNETNVVSLLEAVLRQLIPLQKMHSQYEPLQQRLESSLIEIQDIASEYELLFEKTEFNPALLLQMQNRLDLILRLQQKHQKASVDDLLFWQNELDQRLSEFGSLSEQIKKLQKQVENQLKALQSASDKLTGARLKAINSIQHKVVAGLMQLGMKDAEFIVEITELEEFTPNGKNAVDFLFTSNKGRKADLVAKIASGGELSRLVLTLKTLLSHNRNLPTVVFDEIDTGISGDIAAKVGQAMKNMSANMQVIAITHLPQIAAKAPWHFRVFKKEVNGQTQTDIQQLEPDERLHELALMISGDANSQQAIKMAQELML
jgi:DNA repair protein RecN (Recombination protein N)